MLSYARLALAVVSTVAVFTPTPLNAQEVASPGDSLIAEAIGVDVGPECRHLTAENASVIARNQGRAPATEASAPDSLAVQPRGPLAAPELVGSCMQPALLRAFAEMLLDHQDVADAVTAAEAAVRLDPSDAENHLIHARALHRSNRLEDALASYGEATRVTSDTAVLPSLLAAKVEVLSSLGRWNDALPRIRRYISHRPDDARMRLRLGNALLQLARTEEAMRGFREAVRLEPAEASHWALLALTVTKLGRHGEAVSYWERVLMLDPGFFDGEAGLHSVWEASLRAAGPQPAATIESLLASSRR